MSNPTVVLVHGAWHGGWCWDFVLPHLHDAGLAVLAPSLPGLGERYAQDPACSLHDYVDDLAATIVSGELQDVVLVGHSFGCMVTTAVADRLRARMRSLIYFDGPVPRDGQDFAAAIPGLSASDAERRRQGFRAYATDGQWLMPPEPTRVGVTAAEQQDWLRQRMTPQPLRTWLEPVTLVHGGIAGLEKTYVLATDPVTTGMGYDKHGKVARDSPEWHYREIASGHDMMVTHPRETAQLIIEAARRAS